MVSIGKENVLAVVREAASGLYLDGEQLGEILLPRRYVPQGARPGDKLEVFVYLDSEDRLVATTETPLAKVGEFACLEVVGVHRELGAFLNWGLAKDLLLPFREQEKPVRTGHKVVVAIYLDPKSQRIVASSRLQRHLSRDVPRYAINQQVRMLIVNKTPLGYTAIVENAHFGLLYQEAVSTPLTPGEKIDGFVRAIRPDGKIDLKLDASGYGRVAPLTEQILEALRADANGRLEFDDDSPPESVRQAFGVSKKAFKQALGSLYKARRIRFTHPGIELVDDTRKPKAARAPKNA